MPRDMDRSVDRIHIELRDCQQVVPKVVHTRQLPTLDSKVLLIADLDGDGADEVLVLQGAKHLAFFPLREQPHFLSLSSSTPSAASATTATTTTSSSHFNSPLDGHPLLSIPTANGKKRRAGYLAATVGADGVLHEPPRTLLQQILERHNSHHNNDSNVLTGRALFENQQPQQDHHQPPLLEAFFPSFYHPSTMPSAANTNSSSSSKQPQLQSLTYIQISGLPLFESKSNNSNGNSTATSASSSFDFTVVNALWLDDSKLEYLAAATFSSSSTHHHHHQQQPFANSSNSSGGGTGSGLVLILQEGFVAFVTSKELRKSIERARKPGAAALSSCVVGVIDIHFSQFQSVWEIPWNCCCSAIDPGSATVYVGFACGLVLALPLGQHCFFGGVSSPGAALSSANSPVSAFGAVPISVAATAGLRQQQQQQQTFHNNVSQVSSASGSDGTDAAALPQQQQQQGALASMTTPSAKQQQLSETAGINTSNNAAARSPTAKVTSPASPPNAGIIPASVHSSSLTITDAPIRIALLSYGTESSSGRHLNHHHYHHYNPHGQQQLQQQRRDAVLIAMKDNVVLVDAARFERASFTKTLGGEPPVWALQVSCVSLEVYQISRESAAWCIVTDTGAVHLLVIDGEGTINRCDFKITSSPVASTAPSQVQSPPLAPVAAAPPPPQHQHQHQQHLQQQSLPLGGDTPKHAFIATLDSKDELCVVIVSENGGITIYDMRRFAVHCVGSGSRCISRSGGSDVAPGSASSAAAAAAAATASAFTASAARRVQSVHEIMPLSLSMSSASVQMSPRQAAPGAVRGGIGGGGAATVAPLTMLGGARMGNRAMSDFALGATTATLGGLSSTVLSLKSATATSVLSTTTGFGVGGGTGIGGNNFVTASSALSSAAAVQPELLLVINGYIRHIQVKLPGTVAHECRVQQQTAERLAQTYERLQARLRASGVIGGSQQLLASCGFAPSLLALGNAVLTDRALVDNFRGHQLTKQQESSVSFDEEGGGGDDD